MWEVVFGVGFALVLPRFDQWFLKNRSACWQGTPVLLWSAIVNNRVFHTRAGNARMKSSFAIFQVN